MSLIRMRIPTALGSARRRHPARFAAFLTASAKDGAGPSPKPTLEPFRSFDGSIALIWRPLCDVVDAWDDAAAGVSVAVVAREAALPDPQAASISTPASSRSALRTVTSRTLEAHARPGPPLVVQEAVDECLARRLVRQLVREPGHAVGVLQVEALVQLAARAEVGADQIP